MGGRPLLQDSREDLCHAGPHRRPPEAVLQMHSADIWRARGAGEHSSGAVCRTLQVGDPGPAGRAVSGGVAGVHPAVLRDGCGEGTENETATAEAEEKTHYRGKTQNSRQETLGIGM